MLQEIEALFGEDQLPGDYRLEMGTYDVATGTRLAVGSDDNKVTLMELKV
jgi:hypothetical protein